jgi:hypothetical protein
MNNRQIKKLDINYFTILLIDIYIKIFNKML